MKVVRVYKFGCRAPSPNEEPVALQLLGQAWLYGEDLRRAYNAQKRVLRALRKDDDCAHVRAWSYVEQKRAIQEVRRRRGHLIDYGTYWLVEDAMLQASKSTALDPIRSRPWDGTGRIGAAVQSVEQFPASAPWTHKRVQLSRAEVGYATLTLIVGELKSARSLTWPIKIHRPFPEGSIVKRVAVQRIKHGACYKWEALFTIEFEDRREDEDASGTVGVDVGWRDDGALGMRVATDSGGGVLRIDTHGSFVYADQIRATRDKHFEAAKTYVKEAALPGAEHAHLWRDKERMRRLAKETGDLGPMWWALRDLHLGDFEVGVRTRAVRRRTDAFRRYADALAKKYRILAIEDMPMADWVGEGDTHAKERRRSIAALSELQTVLVHRFGPNRVDWRPCAYSSMICCTCGIVRTEPVGPQERWSCEDCGADHHQDENAAENLRVESERWSDAGNPVRARSRKPKKGKGKGDYDAVGVKKGNQIQVTAREPIGNAAE